MNRADYMAALRRALSVLPEEERANALRYYEEYFDDAGPENEAKAIEELGEPAKVAAQILADYRELTAVPHAQPIKEKRRWRGISPLLLIVLVLLAIPIGLPLRHRYGYGHCTGQGGPGIRTFRQGEQLCPGHRIGTFYLQNHHRTSGWQHIRHFRSKGLFLVSPRLMHHLTTVRMR